MYILPNMSLQSVFLLISLLGSSHAFTSISPAAQMQQLGPTNTILPSPHNPSTSHLDIPRTPVASTFHSSYRRQRKPSHLFADTTLSSSANTDTTSTSEPSILGGTQQFQSWFQSKAVGGKALPELKHATFQSNNLRGLEYDGTKDRGVVEVPEKVVLRTEYNRNTQDGKVDEDWDSRLAVLLVKECLKGEDSDLFG